MAINHASESNLQTSPSVRTLRPCQLSSRRENSGPRRVHREPEIGHYDYPTPVGYDWQLHLYGGRTARPCLEATLA